MAKVNFSARKDPLLRPRPATAHVTEAVDERQPPSPGGDRSRSPETLTAVAPPQPVSVSAVEPPGVIAIAPSDSDPAPRSHQPQVPEPDEPAPRNRHARHSRRVARRVQTSISLPPEVWDTLDQLADGAGVTVGKLLTALLTAAVPDGPTTAFSTVEQLLLTSRPDDVLHEERNYRLPLDLRRNLDVLANALGSGPRPQRSLLIHAIVAAHAPTSSEQVRDLITTHRIDELRTSMLSAAQSSASPTV